MLTDMLSSFQLPSRPKFIGHSLCHHTHLYDAMEFREGEASGLVITLAVGTNHVVHFVGPCFSH